MQSSEIVLYNLSKQAIKDGYVFDRLYRHLYNKDFYLTAYKKIDKNKGSATKNIDVTIQALIASLQDESYQPKPMRRRSIPKEGGIPTVADLLVQEVCRILIEAIYEPNLSNHSHSFRPNRSCHTALAVIKKTFTEVNWFIKGNIVGFSDAINYQILIKILRQRIKDEKFIRLMWKLLKAGFMEDWRFQKTYSGTPQGGIISPILATIYLNEFDQYMENKLQPSLDVYPYDKAIKYVRYADEFMVGVNGSKKDCEQIKQMMAGFLTEQLKLELSQEKTQIRHRTKSVTFLNYAISIRQDRRDVQLRIPPGTIERVMIKNNMVKDIDAKQWDMLHRPRLVTLADVEIVKRYNAELRGLYNYYALADNVRPKMGQLHHVMEYSCLKTLASKYKSTVPKMKMKFSQGKHWGVAYKTAQGESIAYFYKEGFKKKQANFQATIDQLPNFFV